MITLDSFLGALLEQLGRAREISDKASLRTAEYYLHHELLKGFPVPHMQFRDVEVELHFAVASRLHGPDFREDEETRKNITYQLRELLSGLPNHRDFKQYFGENAEIAARWMARLDEMGQRFEQILSKPTADAASAIYGLSLCVRNYFYESASEELRPNVSSILSRSLRKQSSEPHSMQDIIGARIYAIVTSTDKASQISDSEASLKLNVLVCSAELEILNPSVLNRIKITANPADRRWVARDKEGRKVYTLST
jgi:hypothetical protein